MQSFKEKIKQRQTEKFYGMLTNQMLRHLPANEEMELRESFQVWKINILANKFFRIFSKLCSNISTNGLNLNASQIKLIGFC